jgi:N-succinyldiaminopimelate aminotransferase
MPKYPNVDGVVQGMTGSVYSALAHRLKQYSGPVFPLHVGDTWMEPPVGCRMEDLAVEESPGMHRYANPHGLPVLLEAIENYAADRMSQPTDAGNILVTAGATGGLGAVVGALVSPGDEVLILAPYWPLIAGIVRLFKGIPVEVPFIGNVDSRETILEVLSRYKTEKTTAIYLNTPNNPTGKNIPQKWMEAIGEWVREHQLWVISDEVYDQYIYDGTAHTYMRELLPERTFSAFSFSKAYGMAGNRCGYVIGPADQMSICRRVSTHTFYSTPTASQLAATRALMLPEGKAWVSRARARYADLGRAAATRLGEASPEGGTFLFIDVSEALHGRNLLSLLESCVDRGLLVAPGSSFGPYPNHIRLCFTSAEPDLVREGVEILANLLGR